MNQNINIAIDGLSGCGKSTLAKQLAASLGYIYIDTGAMYRAVTWYALQKNISPFDHSAVLDILDDIYIHFKSENNLNVLYLNGRALKDELIGKVVTSQVSHFALIPEVRKKLVALQQKMAGQKGVVMEGRDIGTVVLPEAELKLFIICSDEVRADRRQQELLNKHFDSSIVQVLQNLKERDKIDSSRATGPLKQAEDAILIDNSKMDKKEQLDFVMHLVSKKI